MRKLNEEQIKVLRTTMLQNDRPIKSGPRVSYTPSGQSLAHRGLLEKRGTSRYRTYWITQAGRDMLASIGDQHDH